MSVLMKRKRPLQAPRQRDAHPSVAGSLGYDENHREQSLATAAAGVGHLNQCSAASLRRWTVNGVSRRRRTGNRDSQRWGNGDTFLLCLYRFAYPTATAKEIIAFVANHGADHNIYSPSDVTLAEQRLGLTRKRASTTAYQALRPLNLALRHAFWNRNYPYGRADIPRAHLLDADEAGIFLEKTNKTMGKALSSVRVRAPGVYGHGQRFNLTLVVTAGHFFYHELATEMANGTTYNAFVRRALSRLPVGGPRMTWMHDNVRFHHDGRVAVTAAAAGHRVLARPAYRPVDGPIEYVFNTLQQDLSARRAHIFNGQDLRREVNNALVSMAARGFDGYFAHCGY